MAFVFGAGLVIFGLYQVFQSLGVYSRAQSAMHEGFAATIMLTGVVAISAGLILIALARILVEMRAVRPVVPNWEGRLFGRREPWISVAIDEKSRSLQKPTEEARIEADVAAGNRVPFAKLEPVAADRSEAPVKAAVSSVASTARAAAVPGQKTAYCPMCGFGNPPGTAVCRCGCDLKRHG